jgi:hypothetical protein
VFLSPVSFPFWVIVDAQFTAFGQRPLCARPCFGPDQGSGTREGCPSPHSLEYIQFPSERPVTTLSTFTMHSLRPSVLLLSAILCATQLSFALHVDLPRRSEDSFPNLLSRAPNATSGLDITGSSYTINITLGGKQFAVIIDTGR